MVWGNLVPHQLLELFDLRKSTLFLAGPNPCFVYIHLENTPVPRLEGELVNHAVEGGQEFLCHPGGPQQPVAASAVVKGDLRCHTVMLPAEINRTVMLSK